MPSTARRTTAAELVDESRRLAVAVDILRDRVTAHVDPIAATSARTAARELQDLAELLEDPDLETSHP